MCFSVPRRTIRRGIGSRALTQDSLGVLVQDEATAPHLHKPQAALFR